jgi:LysM repeat protein
VDAANDDRRGRKIRRTGRHTTPSSVEKVAEKAGKAAPAVAIAGVLVAAAPAAHAAVKAPATTAAAAQVRTPAGTVALVRRAQPAARSYTVRSGDSLSKIAEGYYGHAADWRWIYEANRSKISNPNDIFVGERLTIPAHAPASTATYTPKHAKTGAKVKKAVLTSSSSLSGTLGCTGLEELWEAAGGSHAEAFKAAEIAMAESGGRQYAHSPTNDYGYWQINGSHGPAEATYNPMGNAKAAIAISDNGSNWRAWTTYTSGAYQGRC